MLVILQLKYMVPPPILNCKTSLSLSVLSGVVLALLRLLVTLVIIRQYHMPLERVLKLFLQFISK